MSDRMLVNLDSTACPESFGKLMEVFLATFKISIPLNEIFKYAVFMSDDTYASFEWEDKDYGFDIPPELLDDSLSFDNKLLFVQKSKIETVENKKPEWMIYVEENARCDDFDIEPSTFLFIHPVKGEYAELAEALILFLNSINTTFYEIQ